MIEANDIRRYFESELGLDLACVQGDTLLLSSGTVDSFAMLELIVFIEKRTGKKVAATDVNLENLDSIDRIVAFARKHAGASRQ